MPPVAPLPLVVIMPPVEVVVRSVALLPLAAVVLRCCATRRRRVPPVAIVVPPIEVDCRVIGPARRRRCDACRPHVCCRPTPSSPRG